MQCGQNIGRDESLIKISIFFFKPKFQKGRPLLNAGNDVKLEHAQTSGLVVVTFRWLAASRGNRSWRGQPLEAYSVNGASADRLSLQNY